MIESEDDVPSPIDLRVMADAQEWEATAMEKRAWRVEFFAYFASEIAALHVSSTAKKRVLELGSGPGFLAKHLLKAIPDLSYVMLDFSQPMHQLAQARLGDLANHVEFVERSFKEPNWPQGLGQFDCVVTMQAVHELRHKRHATTLHRRVRELLNPDACYLVCDHFCGEGGMRNNQLYMSVVEQGDALRAAGFTELELLMQKGSLALYRAYP